MQGISESTQLKLRIKRKSVLVSKECTHKPNYLINADKFAQLFDGRFSYYQYGQATDEIERLNKVMLVVGATGAGKTTFINSLINYAFGVEYDDDFRFKLITEDFSRSQAHSQTQFVNIYKIHHQEGSKIPYTLTIIDTPGFGDTRGIGRDNEISGELHDLFTYLNDIVDHIDVVAFVAQASLARLTPSQMYIFDSILSLFGKDIENNIFLILTFCDSKLPAILPVINAAKLHYVKCFKFNLSAVFTDNDADIVTGNKGDDESDGGEGLNRKFWIIGMKSFEKLTDATEKTSSKDLGLTQDVQKRRQIINIYVEALNRLIHECLFKIGELKQEQAALDEHKTVMKANESFTIEVEETGYSDQDKFWSILAIVWRGVAFFVNNFTEMNIPVPPIRDVKPTTVKKTRTLASIKERYDKARGACMTVQQVIDVIREDIEVLRDQIMFAVCEIRKNLSILRKNALKHNPRSTLDYIDMLIQNEQAQAKPGWQDRVDELTKVRKCYDLLTKLERDDLDPFKELSELFRQTIGSTPGDFFKTGGTQCSDYKRAKKNFLKNIEAVPECTTQ